MSAAVVDIVVPVHNGAPHLAECLDSVLAQTYQSWRLIVVNNASTDDTASLAESYAARDARIRVAHHSTFVSQAANYNRGLGHVVPNGAEFVKILEADNWISPECLERSVTLAESDPDIGIVGSYWVRGKDVGGSGLPVDTCVTEGAEVGRMYISKRDYVLGTPTSLLFRARALREQGVWFKENLFFDDVDLCVRVLMRWKFGFVHQVLAFIRDDNFGIFHRIRGNDYEPAMRYLLLASYGDAWFDASELKHLRAECEREYFERLAVAWLTRRERSYWVLHETAFEACGFQLQRGRLISAAARRLANRMLNPGSALAGLMWRWRNRAWERR